jgi:hypothetical protein
MRHFNRFAVLLVLFVVGCGDSEKQNTDAETLAPGPLTAAQARQALNELIDAPPGKQVYCHFLLVRLRSALNDPERFEAVEDAICSPAWNVRLDKRKFLAVYHNDYVRISWYGDFRPREDGTWEAKVTSYDEVKRKDKD